MSAVVAMPTIYKGYRFRSRLEARWAMFFDMVGAKWEFEPQPIVVNGEPYLPDFLVSVEADGRNQSIVHEIKPLHEASRIVPANIYLAGKVGDEHNWRGFLPLKSEGSEWRKELVSMSGVPFFYTGPYYSDTGHYTAIAGLHSSADNKRTIVRQCIESIKRADIFCAHISTLDAYGTLVELGIATALGKEISLTIECGLYGEILRAFEFSTGENGAEMQSNIHILGHDMWFAEELSANFSKVLGFKEAQDFHANRIAAFTSREFLLIAGVYLTKPATISFGDPLDVAQSPNCVPYRSNLINTLCSNNLATAQAVRAHRFDRN